MLRSFHAPPAVSFTFGCWAGATVSAVPQALRRWFAGVTSGNTVATVVATGDDGATVHVAIGPAASSYLDGFVSRCAKHLHAHLCVRLCVCS